NIIDVIGVTSENLRNFTGIRVEDRLLPFLRVVFKVFVVVMGALIIVQEFGYSIAGLVASFGIVGLAISLAAQDTAANIIGFTSIVSDNPLHVGEYVIAGDVTGTVEEVGVRTTRIRKLDQSLVTVPNATLTGGAVTNWSRLTKRRLDFYVGLTYNTSASQMRAVIGDIRDMLKERENVDPESVIVHFVEFGDSSLKIRIIAYVLLQDWGEFTAEQENINLRIMEIVEDHKLSMAFPSTSLYIETPIPDVLPDVVEVPAPLPSIQKAIDKQEEIENATQEGTAEAKYQDNEAASSDADGGDAR
ncbi:MAG: mechanosensitive ion channel family protein, partial [Chloroflexota bacterium]